MRADAGPLLNIEDPFPFPSKFRRLMVKFVVSEEIRSTIREYNLLNVPSGQEEACLSANMPFIEHLQLYHVASTLMSQADMTNSPCRGFYRLVKNTSIYIDPKEERKPVHPSSPNAEDQNREYQARMESLRERLKQQEYQRMIANVKPPAKLSILHDNEFTARDARMVKNQLSAIINVIFSMASVFIAVFIWMKTSPDHLVLSGQDKF